MQGLLISQPFALSADVMDAAPARVVLDEGYYLDHFQAVIDDVRVRYQHLLNFAERRYLKAIRHLSPDALCLYVRLINRKGPFFRVGKLHYLPPVSLYNAITELAAQGLLRNVADVTHCAELWSIFTLPELRGALTDPALHKLGKRDLCAALTEHDATPQLMAALTERHGVIALEPSPWEFLKFLFFGQLTPNLSDFVIQALGHVTGETIDAAQLVPRFTTRAAADDCYRLHGLYAEFGALRAAGDATALLTWWYAQDVTRDALHECAHDRFDRLINRLGRLLERAGDVPAAIAVYEHSPVAPSRERLIKLYLKTGQRDAALSLCATGLANPCDAEERYALQQIRDRQQVRETKTGRASAATRLLKNYPSVTLDWTDTSVEQAALAHYAAQGWNGVHSENWLWCNLFGLLCWDLIFDAGQGGFHNTLQRAPQHLFKPGFFANRTDALAERLVLLHETERALAHLADCHTRKNGIANPFVAWHPETLPMLATMLSHVPGAGLAGILVHMATDLGTGCHGFPDLFLWRDQALEPGHATYQFIEVKSQTDRILPQQFNWLQVFGETGVSVGVLRVFKR